ncbi:DUF5682 family protein [Embleya sp. MST-111070]|uniref:vWA domain-containing protein n=1 Tax=Embleya sp. MST-111070 TaxID=3398231 RepID=UPI003F733CC6
MSTIRTDGPNDEARPAAARLAASRRPHLIGVRHHAPSLAAAVPALLDEARPDVLLVELPHEAAPWLEWLAHEDTRAPIALAGTGPHGLGFYPFADFSPELAALRWAARNGVPAIPCDLPLGHPGWDRAAGPGADAGDTGARGGGLHAALRDRLTGRAGDDLWDRLVEATAPGSSAEAIRRAALTVGWALRRDTGGVDPVDLRREAWMRSTLRAAEEAGATRVTVVLGAFHAPALLDGDAEPPAGDIADVTMSLIPYTYPLLDSRSGYPAGIRDPEWQQSVLESAGDPAALREALIGAAVRICTDLRGQGHPSGPVDAREIVRIAGDLANLRGLPAAGRGELLEATQTVLTHGEPLGRGRSVARALERVLVGTRAGRPSPAAPRSGLGPEVERRIAELGLPGPTDPAERDLRLDPLRSDRDRRRELLLQQLTTCRIPYAEPTAVVGTGGADAVTTRWRVRWTPSVAALLDAAGARGVTPEQAAEGTLRAQHHQELAEGGPTAAQILTGLERAAACGLPDLTATRLAETAESLPTIAGLPDLLAALVLTDRIHQGHLGLPAPESASATVTVDEYAEPGDRKAPTASGSESGSESRSGEEITRILLTAAVRHLDGLTGSDDPADARALADLAGRADVFGGVRLTAGLARLAADGSPLMSAAAGAVRVLLGHEDPTTLGDRIGSWIDTATTPATRAELTRRLTGLLTAAGPLLQAGGPILTPLLDRVDTLPDRPFLDRLPALRGGFDTLTPAARDRVLATLADHLGDRVDTDADPITLALWTSTDLTAKSALLQRALLAPSTPHNPTPTMGTTKPQPTNATSAASSGTRAQSVRADAEKPQPSPPSPTPPTGGPQTQPDTPNPQPTTPTAAPQGRSAQPDAVAPQPPNPTLAPAPAAGVPQDQSAPAHAVDPQPANPTLAPAPPAGVPQDRSAPAKAVNPQPTNPAAAPASSTSAGVPRDQSVQPDAVAPQPPNPTLAPAPADGGQQDRSAPAKAVNPQPTNPVAAPASSTSAGVPRDQSVQPDAVAPQPLNPALAPAPADGGPQDRSGPAHAVDPQPANPAPAAVPPAPDGRPRGRSGSADAVNPQPAGLAERVGGWAKIHDLPPAQRWKLILGRQSDRLPPKASGMARALDELYGTGHGEGSRSDLGDAPGAGREAPYPGVREWSEDLIALFGPAVREEVLAAAASAGRTDVLTHLDPAAARPSVDLLKTVLTHAGGLPESKLALLRPLIARIVAELARELATRLRPALTGITTPRPTRRPGGALDLPRTLRANLTTARRAADGSVLVVPEKPIFRTRASRSNDWRLILVVDVSGSMEASTIWSALTASIMAGVPSLSTHFLTFSTEVIDLTGHVHDPLGLLLEVKVGGGTHIAAGLRAARDLVTVPSRTLIAVVSDFEEGYPIGGLLAEVRALASSGCHILGCASLDDAGRPRYSTAVAGRLVAAGMPVAALSPTELARWVGEKVR